MHLNNRKTIFHCSIPSGLSFMGSTFRRLAPAAIIVQSAVGGLENSCYPEKGETKIAVPIVRDGKDMPELKNPKGVQPGFKKSKILVK